jgi:hypothetical protein
MIESYPSSRKETTRTLSIMGNNKEDIGPYTLDTEGSPHSSQDQLVVKPISKWYGYIWDTWELPKDQRVLLFKLDAFVLTFASVSAALPTIERNRIMLIWFCTDWLLPQEY